MLDNEKGIRMKKLIICLFITSLIAGCATTPSPKPQQSKNALESSLRLELKSQVRTLRLGQSQRLKLQISGSEVSEITEASEGLDFDSLRPGAFVYNLNFNPQRKGSFTFGPYSIEVNGQKLESNQVKINVLPQWDGICGTFFRIDTNSIVLGDSVELTMETWTKDAKYISILPKRNESFSVKLGSGGGSTSTSGYDNVRYSNRSYFITPKKTGEFKITKELFREFPEDINAPDLTVMVKEK